jgi:hypothetical protein
MTWNDDWMGEDEDYREELEERRYWLDWADGVLNQDPEPGEAPEEVHAGEDSPLDLDLPEVLEALSASGPWLGGLAGAIRELEREAGMFQEGRVRAKLHLLRLLLALLPLPDEEPLLRGQAREDAASEPRAVKLTKADLMRVVEGWLELYTLDFPGQAYEEMKGFRRFLEGGLLASHPALDQLLSAWSGLWDHLEALKDPDLDIPPWAFALVQEALKRRKRGLKRRLDPKLNLLGLHHALEESDDLYELVALEAFLGLAEGE